MSESPAYRLRKKIVPKSNLLLKKATKKLRLRRRTEHTNVN